ncbi:MAG TPA: amidohydrolase family protein [Mycobacteriales bacterium]|nr:amidohydrolase family protein [Mycobacteriales bacterium]
MIAATQVPGAGAAFTGRLWCGDGRELDRGRVVIDGAGVVAVIGAAAETAVPAGAREIESAWIGPGLVDAHVHLAFGTPEEIVARGVVAVRDLGAPPPDAMRWRAGTAPRVQVAGPLLTAPGGYPSRSWGQDGFAAFIDDVGQASRLVQGLATQVDVIKLALEPNGGPVPEPDLCAAVVEAAHESGLEVTCHALSTAMVERALDAGVDELAHVPLERLPAALVARIAATGVRVVSTAQTHLRNGEVVDNLRDLVSAGVAVRYGTDLGNGGTRPGADPRELDLLAGSGLGADGALRAATEPIRVGQPAGLVALRRDPREHTASWTEPHAVMVGPTLLVRS